jgi:hypothetical protein
MIELGRKSLIFLKLPFEFFQEHLGGGWVPWLLSLGEELLRFFHTSQGLRYGSVSRLDITRAQIIGKTQSLN